MITPTIIYEDENLLVLDKPSGLVVHSNGEGNEYTLASFVKERNKEMIGVGENMFTEKGVLIERPGMVHRLDRDTSGVMVLAKNQPTYIGLKRFFSTRKVVKEYHAFVYGTLKHKRGTITAKIGRSATHTNIFTTKSPKGKLRDAETEYSIMWSDKNASFVRFFPLTGRTHQVRVHAKHIGHQIIKDPLYAKKKSETDDTNFGFDRLALHARRITIPYAKKEMTFYSPYPKDFKKAFAKKQIGKIKSFRARKPLL